MPSPTKRLTYSVDEVAEMLGISRNTAYAAVRRGEIRSLRFGNRIRVPKVEIDRLINGEEK